MKANIPSVIAAFLCLGFLGTKASAQDTGIFESHNDIGPVLHKGTVAYDANGGTYVITGSGANIWGASDEFHFAWRKLKGNFILQARAKLMDKGVDPHRKLGWMVRKSLDTSSSSVNATVHGDGLTSLQYRKVAGGTMEEKKFDTKAPDVIQLERRGNRFIMSVAHSGELFVSQDISDIDLGDDVYVGLFVCAHNKDVVEKGSFDNVRITVPAKETLVPYREYIGSNMELFDIASGKRKIIYSEPGSLQAPNWMKDGKSLLYNKDGLIYQFYLKQKSVSQLNTGEVRNNNNDHVISFDGKMLGLSSTSPDKKYGSVVYTVPITGGTPKQITPIGLSYLHGWSPDGKWLTFTGQRDNEFDIYKIPSAGGDEVRLTTAKGLDDGPEYSPDGRYIYFNSTRSGKMQIWRMKPDGSEQTQLTNDTLNNWFPHISPDGKTMVFLSFGNDVKPDDHPFYKHVYIRNMPVGGGEPRVLVYLYGGQGTINTPSWSPNSKQFAFVSNSDLLFEK
ncbi:TolB family protein [Flavisolibacter nicotianae]|uniref:TolB family protein n=1 Tax=Flavisolibacter nicotianae TaxID=2364882 RepID=UPI000EB08FC7|nr:TolB family protein [Flavisolibacter nicotianae]